MPLNMSKNCIMQINLKCRQYMGLVVSGGNGNEQKC